MLLNAQGEINTFNRTYECYVCTRAYAIDVLVLNTSGHDQTIRLQAASRITVAHNSALFCAKLTNKPARNTYIICSK